jgi:arylsulfatase A-like enzyme
MTRRRTCVIGLFQVALFAAGVLGCEGPPPEERSVVLLVLDAAGARYFGCYGNALPTTPHIDAFAEDATVFERAYAQAAFTLPSMGSVMTGRYPPVRSADLSVVEPQMLAQVLHEAGLRTAAFSENPFVTHGFGMATGFEEFTEYFPFELVLNSPLGFGRRDSERTVDHALAWVRKTKGERFFLYVHILAPHAPYDPLPPFGGRFDPDYRGAVHGVPKTLAAIDQNELAIDARDLEHLRLQYQENLAYADHQAGRLLDGLEALGVLDRTLVIIAGDHGEAFREHGAMEHNTTVYEEMIHVPLVVRMPSEAALPQRFGGVVELRSIFPTICEALGIASCPERLAPSLFEQVRRDGERPGLARSWARGRNRILAALVLQRHKLIARVDELEPLALYDLARDAGETTDLRLAQPELLGETLSRLRDPAVEFFVGREAAVDPVTRERLEALGYAQ